MMRTEEAIRYARLSVLYAPARRTAKPLIIRRAAQGSSSVVRHDLCLLGGCWWGCFGGIVWEGRGKGVHCLPGV
jgi:hypothetical protein